jgi:nucleotide-binding universal stress UspA family protein
MQAAEPAAIAVPEKRKFLVVVDQTPECANALRYAARRAAKTGRGVTMLYVVPRPELQHFAGIEQVMREEAHADAQQVLREQATRLKAETGIEAELAVREGTPAQEILKLVGEDPAVHVLVLAAGAGKDGPGPLVSSFSGQLAGTMPIPVTIVPGHLEPGQIDRIA